MATYQPIVTGYKPEGALGALYAGENAAMGRQQTESANLADLFDAYQKQAAIQKSQFDLGESQYAAPNVRAVSDLSGATARYMSDPTRVAQMGQGQLGQAQSLAATGAKDTALLPSAIVAGKAENVSKVATAGFTEASKQVDTIAGLAQQSPLMAASYINQNITDPQKKGEYLRLLQTGQIPKLQQQFALENQAHLAEMDKERYKGGIEIQKANISARSYANTAEKQLAAAQLAASKLDLQSAEAAAKASLDAYKAAGDEIGKMIDQFKPEQKQSQIYRDLQAQQVDLRNRMIETSKFITTLRQPTTPGTPTSPPVPTPPAGPVAGSFVRDPKTGKLVLQK